MNPLFGHAEDADIYLLAILMVGAVAAWALRRTLNRDGR